MTRFYTREHRSKINMLAKLVPYVAYEGEGFQACVIDLKMAFIDFCLFIFTSLHVHHVSTPLTREGATHRFRTYFNGLIFT